MKDSTRSTSLASRLHDASDFWSKAKSPVIGSGGGVCPVDCWQENEKQFQVRWLYLGPGPVAIRI